MKTLYRFAANTVFVFHILLGIFFLVGWIFPSIKMVYLPLLIAWPLSWVVLGYCPTTKLELLLRKKYDKRINTNAESIQYNAKKYLGVHIASRPIFIGGISVFFVLFFLSIMRGL